MVIDLNINQEHEELDFLGNDLFLIVETHEELINSLIGYYAKLDFNQKDTNEYFDKIISLRKLKLELALNLDDLDFQKKAISQLEQELKEVKALKL